ncbi:ABC transporter permease [Gemmatimonadota bacterium]
MDRFTSELRQVIRRLFRNPGFTIIAVFTLALGIGANTTIFSLVNGILLKPLPFDEPDQLVGVWHTAPGLEFEILNQSPALHFTYLDEGNSFAEIGMWDNGTATVTGLAEPQEVELVRVTHGTLRALRLQPTLGRRFTLADDSPGTPETLILSHDYWQTQLGGDPEVLGRTLTVDGRTREIIGVMPADVRFLHLDPAFFLPFQFDRANLFVGNFSYQALARLNPGVTLEEANADVARMGPLAVEIYPGGVTLEVLEQARFGPNLRPLKNDVVGNVGEVLWVLLGSVSVILLIACANVANLFLVRAEGREREMAVRTAMGAAKGRIAKEFLKESLLLGVLGGLGGVAMAFGGLKLLVALGPSQLPRLGEVSLDLRVLSFTLALSVLSGVFFGLFPILKYRKGGMIGALKEGGRGGSLGRERHQARNVLVVAQMALALLLLVGSGLMIRSFQALRNVDPGFRSPEEVLLVRLSIPSAQVEEPEEVTRTFDLLAQRLRQVPGVTAVGFSQSVTMDGWNSNDPVFVEEFPMEEGSIPPIRRFKWVGEDYFEAMQIPMVAGRALELRDSYDLTPVAMVSETFAREYWDSPAEAVGKRISVGLQAGNWAEIIGVSGNVRDDGLDVDPTPVIYWPMMQRNLWEDLPGEEPTIQARRSMYYVIRSSRVGSPEFLPQVRDAIWSVNPNLPLASVRTLEDLLSRSMARTSFSLIMLGIAAAVALFLGAIGIYGVISYIVSQRTRELGVRMALGAEAAEVKGMVLKQGMILAGIGVLIGLGSALGVTRLMTALLYGVNPVDPLTLGAVALILSVVAMVASYVPAHRAAKINPVEAIRYD